MPTKSQIEKRQNNIGASDVAALLGVSKYKSKYDLWLEKTGQVEPQEENEAMRNGNRLERAILAYASESLGPITRRNTERRYLRSKLLVHLDASVSEDGMTIPVEAKSSGLLSPLSPDWGEFATDEVPLAVVAQCMAQMMCINPTPPFAHVPALLGGRGFGMYRVSYNEEIVGVIRDAIKKFWVECVYPRVAPIDSQATLDMAKRIRRVPEKLGTVNEAAVNTWIKAKEGAKGAIERVDEAKAFLLQELGNCEAAIVEESGEVITYYEQARRGYVVDETSFRVLRHKPKGF